MTGEHLAADLLAFLRALGKHHVRYLLVGGEAVIHHGYPRLTGDIDLFYDRSASNAERLYDALADFWGGDVPVVASANELLEPDIVIQFGRPPNRIDLIGTLGSLDFASAWRRRVVEKIRVRPRSISLPIISLEDLIAVKREAGRNKDLDDVEHLLAIAKKKKRTKRRPPT